MPTDNAPMVIALGEAYTGGDKGLPQNAVAARKSTARPDPPRPSGPPVPHRSPLALDVQKGAITMVDLLDGLVAPLSDETHGQVVARGGFSVSLPPPRPSSTLLQQM